MSLWTLVIYLDGDSKLFLLYKYKSFQFAKGSVLYDQVPPAVEQLKREVWDIYIFQNVRIFKYPDFWIFYYIKINVG